MLPDQDVGDLLGADVAQEDCADALIFRRWRRLAPLFNLVHNLLRDRVIDAIEAFPDLLVDAAVALLQTLQVLLRDVRMAVGAGHASIAVTLDEERTDVCCVSLRSLGASEPSRTDIAIVLASDRRQRVLHFWVVVREVKLVDVSIHLVGPEVAISGVRRHHNLLVLLDKLVTQLDWQAEVQVENACLANVLDLGARLADLRLFVPRRLVLILRAGFPAEDCEGPLARLALSGELRACHAHVGVVAEASLAEDGEVTLLPALLVDTRADAQTSFAHLSTLPSSKIVPLLFQANQILSKLN